MRPPPPSRRGPCLAPAPAPARAPRRMPQLAGYLFGRGDAHRKLGDSARALHWYGRSGREFRALLRRKGLGEELQKACRTGVAIVEHNLAMAAATLAPPNHSLAIAHYVEALEWNAGQTQSRTNLAQLYEHVGDAERSEQEHRRAVAAQPPLLEVVHRRVCVGRGREFA